MYLVCGGWWLVIGDGGKTTDARIFYIFISLERRLCILRYLA